MDADELSVEFQVLKDWLGIEIKQCSYNSHILSKDQKCINCGLGPMDFGKYIARI